MDYSAQTGVPPHGLQQYPARQARETLATLLTSKATAISAFASALERYCHRERFNNAYRGRSRHTEDDYELRRG